MKTWELLSIIAGCFTPSPYFMKYVIKYLEDVSDEGGDAKDFAIYCKDRLDKTLGYSKRMFVPTIAELTKVKVVLLLYLCLPN